MSTQRWLWRVAVGVTGSVAVAGTVLIFSIEATFALLVATALFGAIMGLAVKGELPDDRHPILGGAAVFAAPLLYPGLSLVLGPAAIGVVAALVLTSPWVASGIERRLRGRVLPSQTEVAGMAPPDEALRLQWMESTRELERASTLPERLLVVHLREQILNDLVERSDGAVPEFVWSSVRGRGGPDRSARGS